MFVPFRDDDDIMTRRSLLWLSSLQRAAQQDSR